MPPTMVECLRRRVKQSLPARAQAAGMASTTHRSEVKGSFEPILPIGSSGGTAGARFAGSRGASSRVAGLVQAEDLHLLLVIGEPHQDLTKVLPGWIVVCIRVG